MPGLIYALVSLIEDINNCFNSRRKQTISIDLLCLIYEFFMKTISIELQVVSAYIAD